VSIELNNPTLPSKYIDRTVKATHEVTGFSPQFIHTLVSWLLQS